MIPCPAPHRAYLVGILAEGAVLAAKTEMRGQLEDWTGSDLEPLLPEINAALDMVEAGAGWLIDGSRQDIEPRCAGLPGRDADFSGWDQVLLGRSGRAHDLFDFALRKFAPLATLPSPQRSEGRAVVVRALPLGTTPDAELGQALLPGGWNLRQRRIHSGISLFDEHGHYRYDPDLLAREVLRPAVQDALLEHPVYRAIVNLAICAWRSPATTMPSIELNLAAGHRVGEPRSGCCRPRCGALAPHPPAARRSSGRPSLRCYPRWRARRPDGEHASGTAGL